MASVVNNSSGGQSHNRIADDADMSMAHMMDTHGSGSDASLDITLGQKMMSAVAGSLMTSVLVTPLDVVRVRLQSQKPASSAAVDFSKLAMTTNKFATAKSAELGVTACCREVFFAGNNAEYCVVGPKMEGSGAAAAADCAVEETQRKTYRSTLDGFRKIARNEGITTLWRGLSPTLAMAVPGNIIYFSGYDWLRYSPKSPFSKFSDDYAPLTAGSVARILAATSIGPIELLRTRMQAVSSASSSNHLLEAVRGAREMVASHGLTSMWRGLTLTLWRDVPFSGLYWWGYEVIRGKLTQLRDEQRGRSLSSSEARGMARRNSQSSESHAEILLDSFVSGATSGALASIITTPFDVGKTRTQVYRDAPSKPSASASAAAAANAAKAPEEQNMVRLLWHIFQNEGAAGLWKGWIPRTLKVAPACAIMISSYEVGKRVFRGVNERALSKRQGEM